MCCDYSQVDTLVADLENLLESGRRADVVFYVGPHKHQFNGHSMIVAARCRRLYPRVRTFLAEKRQRSSETASKHQHGQQNILEVFLLDYEPAVMHSVLRYMYTGKIKLNLENSFDVYAMADELGIPRLLELVGHHLDVHTDVHHVLELLQGALSRGFNKLGVQLIKCAASNCSDLLRSDSILRASASVLLQLVVQEDLNASEDEVWDALVRWACAQSGISPAKKVSVMSGGERQHLVEHLGLFLRPGRMRILNLSATTFAHEVEPLGLLSTQELLLKYRFDAAKDVAGFELAFPRSCLDFLTRIRRRVFTFESAHPHACGVDRKVPVTLPTWATKVRIDFDSRCELGQYAELSFFQDEACSTMLSILTDTRRERWNGHMPQLSVADGLTLHLPSSRFWFTFYSPGNFAARWGYKFSVHTI